MCVCVCVCVCVCSVEVSQPPSAALLPRRPSPPPPLPQLRRLLDDNQRTAAELASLQAKTKVDAEAAEKRHAAQLEQVRKAVGRRQGGCLSWGRCRAPAIGAWLWRRGEGAGVGAGWGTLTLALVRVVHSKQYAAKRLRGGGAVGGWGRALCWSDRRLCERLVPSVELHILPHPHSRGPSSVGPPSPPPHPPPPPPHPPLHTQPHAGRPRCTPTPQLETRVRHTVGQRDDTIAGLRDRLEESEVRRRHAESALAKQRVDLLAAVQAE